MPRAGRWAQRLEAAGIDLASVTDVVLTYMHMDHVGGLLVDGVKDRLRPDLRVHLAALVFAVGFDHPDWHNGFEHYPEEAARVRVRLMRELAATASRWWPASAMWRSPATSFVGYRAPGSTDRLLG